MSDYLATPLDDELRDAIGTRGLTVARLATDDSKQVSGFVRAIARGFLNPSPSEAEIVETASRLSTCLATAVYDSTAAEPGVPVATIDGWPQALALPGGTVDSWAISGVTVAPTHRRLGLARSLVEAELRCARDLDLSVASLTVTEASIYGRFGFGPAAFARDLTVDTTSAGWSGPTSFPGRVQFVDREAAIAATLAVHPRSMPLRAGGASLHSSYIARMMGDPSDEAQRRALRYLRYDDAAGTPQGLAVYRVRENESDFAKSTVEVEWLISATDDAYAALWKFLLSMDLIGTVKAPLRPVDEPLPWLLGNPRAVRTSGLYDHHWLRILDVATILGARHYNRALSVTLAVHDALGHADGNWHLSTAADGRATVEPASFSADVELDVSDLGSAFLGGVSWSTLAATGRVQAADPQLVQALDVAFTTHPAPWLGTWY